MLRRRVFISFLAEDRKSVDGLRLLAANLTFDLELYDESVRVAIDSRDADYLKRRIRDKIGRASVTVCLLSEQTFTSRWVDWELEESFRQGNSLIAMGVKGVTHARLPRPLAERGYRWWLWDPAYLQTLIARA